MSRRFKVSSNYDGGPWYDPKSQTWFTPGKTIDVRENKDYTNINKYILRNYLIEIVEKPEVPEKDSLLKSTSRKILAEEQKKIREIVQSNVLEEVNTTKEEPKEDSLDLNSMTKNQLVELAEEKGIEIDKRNKKETIIETIEKSING